MLLRPSATLCLGNCDRVHCVAIFPIYRRSVVVLSPFLLPFGTHVTHRLFPASHCTDPPHSSPVPAHFFILTRLRWVCHCRVSLICPIFGSRALAVSAPRIAVTYISYRLYQDSNTRDVHPTWNLMYQLAYAAPNAR